MVWFVCTCIACSHRRQIGAPLTDSIMPRTPIPSTSSIWFAPCVSSCKGSAFYILTTAIVLISSTMANELAKAVVSGNNRMVGQLYQEIATPNENLVFSPLSLHTILSLVYQGSAGSTQQALQTVLSVPDKLKTAEGYESIMSELNNVPDVTLEIANRIYVKNGYDMKPAFLQVASKQFSAGAENIDFKQPNAAKTMNTWVEGKTNNKIKDLIQQGDLDDLTRMVLINAVYFKGNWADQFKKENTCPDKFYISETDTVPCEMMFRNGKYRYRDDSALDAQVIELPYKNPAVSMVIVLPRSKTGIRELEKKMAAIDLNTLTADMYSREVDLSLPKFKIESTLQLNDPLSKIGLADAFGDSADFSELLNSKEQLKISQVVQKAFIEVNEEGAEAAAATGCVMRRKRCLQMAEKYEANRPFQFYLIFTPHQNQQDDIRNDNVVMANKTHIWFHGCLLQTEAMNDSDYVEVFDKIHDEL